MRAQKRLLLIDRAACCCSAKNVLLIFCFHQIFHLKYESGNEAVSRIHKERQSCCFAFGSAALGGGQEPGVTRVGPAGTIAWTSTQSLTPGCGNHDKGKMGLKTVRPTYSASRKARLVPGGLANIKKNGQQTAKYDQQTQYSPSLRNKE